MVNTKSLTSQQNRVLRFVQEYSRRQGYPPTLREIGEAVGLANVNAVRGHVAALEKKGYITKAPDKARSIQVVPQPSAVSRVKRRLHEVLKTDEGVFHQIVYALAWTTHRRSPWLTGPIRAHLEQVIESQAVEHGWVLLDRRIEPDHIIVVVATWPNHSPEQTVRRLQGAARKIGRRRTDTPAAGPTWGRGYVVTTDLERLEELVDKLLANETADAAPG